MHSRKLRIQSNSFAASVPAMYSASVVDKATMACFLDFAKEYVTPSRAPRYCVHKGSIEIAAQIGLRDKVWNRGFVVTEAKPNGLCNA